MTRGRGIYDDDEASAADKKRADIADRREPGRETPDVDESAEEPPD